MSKPVILTGLRANNDLHIGNYLGALLPMVDMANKKADEYQINLFVPDLHSFTTPIDHTQLYAQTLNNLKLFIAAGLDINHPDIHIYRQSYISAHSELTWILDCFVKFGELFKMTQFKDKSRNTSSREALVYQLIDSGKYPFNLAESTTSRENTLLWLDMNDEIESLMREQASVGLFNYPVLMAVDILLYGASYVPVGDDQAQHIEFTRDIGERINNKFGEILILPKPISEQHKFFGKDQGLRIRDLLNPAKKMSKSDESGKGVIFLGDTPETARQKIMGAATDSLCDIQYDYAERPGISNLLDVLTLFGGNKQDFIGQNQYGALKSAIADKIAEFLQDFQAKFAVVDDQAILHKLELSEEVMRGQANETLFRVQQAVGLRK